MSDQSQERLYQLAEESPDPLSNNFIIAFGIIGLVTALRLKKDLRETWEQRTTVGKLVLVAVSPLHAAMALLLAVLSIAWILIGLVFASPWLLWMAYRRVAFKDAVK